MDALRSLVQPLVSGSSVVDGMKLVVIGGTVETARRVSSTAWNHFINSFFLSAHFSEEDQPYDWLMLWLSRRPEWQRSREFETTTRAAHAAQPQGWEDDPELGAEFGVGAAENGEEGARTKTSTRVIFQPTADATHTIFWRNHWLRVKRGRGNDGYEMLSISVVARSNTILKALVLQAKKEYEAESVHRIQIFFADPHGSWRWADARHKRPMGSIVLDPGVKEMLLGDARDFLASEKWYADRGIPFRRGYLLHGVPGSGKSSLIHAIAGELMLDIYVVSLSSAWISDSVLMGLMGRVPKGAILLLEDLDAAFTRSTSRGDGDGDSGSGGNGGGGGKVEGPEPPPRRRGRGTITNDLNDLNTLSLSGLLNALDGVAAAEGRILFATTNHLEKLDPALSRPGRMDVWVEFRNASRWQAEALFRNFFPVEVEPEQQEEEDRKLLEEAAAADIELNSGTAEGGSQGPSTPTSLRSASTSSLWSGSGFTSSSLLSAPSSPSPTPSSSKKAGKEKEKQSEAPPLKLNLPQFGSSNTAYLPPPPAPEIAAQAHSARALDAKTLSVLAKRFADAVPEGEFSVAALQGYLLKNKARPEAAADEAGAWVVTERETRERMRKEKEEREKREKIEREKRRKEAAEKAKKEKEAAAKKEAEEAKAKKEEEKENAKAKAKEEDVEEEEDVKKEEEVKADTTSVPETSGDTSVSATLVAAETEAAPAPAPAAESTATAESSTTADATEPTAEAAASPSEEAKEDAKEENQPTPSDSESSDESEYEDADAEVRRPSAWIPVAYRGTGRVRGRVVHSQWASRPL